MAEIERIGNVFYVVDDVEESMKFYRDVIGLKLKFQDGDRWAAFDVGTTTLALARSEAQEPRSAGATVSLRASDVDEWAAEASQRGLAIGEVETGPHERTLSVTDPDGNRLVVFSPLSQP